MIKFSLGNYAERFKDKPVAEIRAERDELYQAILEYVRKFDIDLLVLGKHPRNRLEEYLVGSTVHYAINEAECDVLITTPA